MDLPTYAPIVGTYHRGMYAIAICKSLPEGSALILEPDPGNKFDANAVKVLVDLQQFPQDHAFWKRQSIVDIKPMLEEMDILGAPFHLGFIESSKTGIAGQVSKAMQEGKKAQAVLQAGEAKCFWE
jgi:hypothetical protein